MKKVEKKQLKKPEKQRLENKNCEKSLTNEKHRAMIRTVITL